MKKRYRFAGISFHKWQSEYIKKIKYHAKKLGITSTDFIRNSAIFVIKLLEKGEKNGN